MDTPQHRPAWHFTPPAQWMNDPNGLVFHQGVYHLFYQHHPHSPVWGPMHWGHATSTDLLHWQHQPVALKPGPLGLVFSGCAVLDEGNRAGLGPPGSQPLVAVFTHHDMAAEQAGRIDRQHQSLAFSLDGGQTWTEHAGNPVLRNPGCPDFRDPKLCWLPARQRWWMSLACGDHIAFYSAADLRHWQPEGRFGGPGIGAHGGVWECPDLSILPGPDGRLHAVLLVSLTPGGPNGGSATQYFIGSFDGPDNYAGVTWTGLPGRALFIGWMNNWRYAQVLPTAPWRGAMTMPRDLALRPAADGLRLASRPAAELAALEGPARLDAVDTAVAAGAPLVLSLDGLGGLLRLQLESPRLVVFMLELTNTVGDRLALGFDPSEGDHGTWWIDRRHSGEVDFHPDFAAPATAPRLSAAEGADLDLWFDTSSVELFADGGLTTMTSLFFPRAPWSLATLTAPQGLALARLRLLPLGDLGQAAVPGSAGASRTS